MERGSTRGIGEERDTKDNVGIEGDLSLFARFILSFAGQHMLFLSDDGINQIY